MSTELPSSWLEVAIKDVLEIRNGYAFKSADYQEDGIFLVRQTNLNEGRVTKDNARYLPENYLEEYEGYTIEKGDLLIGMSGSIGDVSEYKLDEIALQNQRTGLFKFLISNKFLKKYVQYYLTHIEQNLKNKSKGVAVQNISATEIESFDLPLPPIKEQQRIVDKIEKLFSKIDDGIKSLQKLKKQLHNYRQTVLKAAVEGKLTQEWREENRDSLESADQLLERLLEEHRERWEEQYRKKYEDKGKDLPKNWKSRYSEPESPDESDLNDLPSGWRWITMEQLADVETGATPLRGETEYWENGTIPWITSSVVNQSKVKSADEYTTQKALKETNIKYFPKGTIVMAMYGEGKTRGKFTELEIKATTNQACAGIITQDTGSVVKPFLKLFLKYNYERIRLKASGGVQPNLNLGIIRSIDLPLPPLKEQQEIVGRVERILSVIDQHKKLVKTELKRASKIKQSILKKAFKGNLVPQNQDDEPASELLKRINSEGDKVDQQVEMGL